MTVAALELNDFSLLIQAEDGALHAEPGFARLTDDGVVTGEAARAVAWREPQHVYNQYWCQLNQAPLPIHHRFARSHADIAFAQLNALWQGAGSPDALLLLVPGSFTDEQLSLLLGMVEALPARAVALVDSALAACSNMGGDTLYLDLQMHDSVITICRLQGDTVRVAEQEILPGLGMAQIQNSLARHISDIMIESYRFDPLHSSATEQAIFDQAPHWLGRLCWERDVPITLETDQGEHRCVLNRDVLKKQLGERLLGLGSFLESHRQCRLLLSHSSGLIRGLVDELAETEALDQTAAALRCLENIEQLPDPDEGVFRLHEMRRASGAAEPEPGGGRTATHLLFEDLALPLHQPVSIRVGEHGPSISPGFDEAADLAVVLRKQSLETLQQSAEVSLPPSCRQGESIRVAGHEFRLIRVRDA